MSLVAKLLSLLSGVIAWFILCTVDRMDQEIAEHTRLDQECIKKGGSYYTKYEKDGVGCYQVVQERITKKLY